MADDDDAQNEIDEIIQIDIFQFCNFIKIKKINFC